MIGKQHDIEVYFFMGDRVYVQCRREFPRKIIISPWMIKKSLIWQKVWQTGHFDALCQLSLTSESTVELMSFGWT